MITNPSNFPESLVRAIKKTTYDPGDSDITVTQLISPPQIIRLRRENQEKLVDDVADMIWALLGSSVHSIIERAAGGEDLQECRLYANVGGWKVGGQVDNVAMKTGIITDYKVTSVYQVKNGLRPEWEAQLNYYAALVRENGGHVGKLQVVAILRDWSKHQIARQQDYPTKQAVMVEIPLWEHSFTLDHMAERVRLHNLNPPPECLDEDRWAKPDSWAVMKAGRKTALRVLDGEERAEAWMQSYLASNANGVKPGGSLKLTVEHRPGNRCVRCDDYCNVRDFCPQYKLLKGGVENEVDTQENAPSNVGC